MVATLNRSNHPLASASASLSPHLKAIRAIAHIFAYSPLIVGPMSSPQSKDHIPEFADNFNLDLTINEKEIKVCPTVASTTLAISHVCPGAAGAIL